MALAAWYLLQGNFEFAAGWATNAVMIFFLYFGINYLTVTFRTGHDFARLALVNVVQNALALALVALVAVFSFYGLCLRVLISSAVGTALLYYWRPVRVRPKWNFSHWKHLLAIGFPIFVVGWLYALWTVLDSTLVLGYLGTEGMGLYAMAIMVGGAMDLVPTSVAQGLVSADGREVRPQRQRQRLVRHVAQAHHGGLRGYRPFGCPRMVLDSSGSCLRVAQIRGRHPRHAMEFADRRRSALAPINSVFIVAKRQDLYAVAIVLGIAVYGEAWHGSFAVT